VKEPFNTLGAITNTLLKPEIDYSAVRNVCVSLSSFFCELSGFDMESLENREHKPTHAGIAVSPYAAAFCITDMMRTRNFVRGIKEAIDVKLRTKKNEPVIVFYAGTGPFGTLLIPLTTIFTASQLQLVLMDINPISIKHLKIIINQLNLQSYIIDVVEADGLSYSIPLNHQPDILVSETMKPGFKKEPQVSIIANLISQCNPGTILIPELVKVDVCLAGNIAKNPEVIIVLRTLFEFNSQTAKQIKEFPETVPVLAEGVTVEILKQVENYGRVVLTTAVKILMTTGSVSTNQAYPFPSR